MNFVIGYAASINETNILDSLNFALENGFGAVEINMNMKCFFPENYSEEEIFKILEFKEKNNLEITFHAPEDIFLLNLHEKVRRAGIDRLKEIIDFAKKIQASRITIHVGPTPYFTLTEGKAYLEELYYDEYKAILRDTLIELVDYCDDKVKLCVENSGRFPEKLVQEVLRELLVNSKLCLTWDIGHSYTNVYNELEFFKANMNKVRTVHLHDVNEKSDHQIIGNGYLNFEEYMNFIGDKDIVYIIEVRPKENALKSFHNIKKSDFMI